ncbi:SGNH/GDSL hydrolase family protein [Paractinoplanes atraurantiacus]|uniref:GDSL-like Lipase/Acylhydrolase family protein n=1 Tax=Paractinoplanes atraurantiacus TaxID=1036182 RepID=A0A285KF92_9ACTN|nr:SGNH/GDSL hydrolase family protein [Actinoplanes atraurantiacus]SNY71275.1 GDSL-like Lipase/Acylhydrolase family protein [Actinoplanes atraurantiacus]
MITTPITAALVRGAAELEPTPHGLLPHRLPAWARAQTPDPQLAMVEAQPSGVRVVFRTRATTIELLTVPTKRVFKGLPPRPEGVYDLLADGTLTTQATAQGGNVLTVDMATGTSDYEPGAPVAVPFTALPTGDKTIEIWLPHNETTELVALRTDAPVEPVGEPGTRPVWVHHGSSISQGSNATSPTSIWPVRAALRAGADLVNLGFGGSALLDPFVARTIRDTPADLITVKLGINLVNADLMRRRAFTPAVHGFLDTIRDGHPTTPLVVISALYCPIHEDTPGPGAFDPEALKSGEVKFIATGTPDPTRLTLRVIREDLARVVTERKDENLSYINGLDLYGVSDAAEHPLPDRLHPETATHHLIADRFVERVWRKFPGDR